MIKKEVTENGLVADLFTEESDQLRKAIILLGGSEGGKSWSRIKRPVELLVQRGYTVLSLAYFKSTGLPDSLEEIPIEYFEKAFDWLSKQDSIIRDEYAILGGSKGAEIALWLGSKYSQLKAVIALSPSSVIWQGIPINRYDLGKGKMSSWSYQGESLPFLPYPTPIKKSDLLFLRLKKIHEAALQNINHPKDAIVEDAIVEETIIEEAIVEEAIVEEAIVEEAIVEDGHQPSWVNKS